MTRIARLRGAALVVPAMLLAAGCLLVGCSDGDPSNRGGTPTPAPTYTGPGEVQSIESNTQMHLEGVAVGAGNFWEEKYSTPDGTQKRGLTGALFITVEDDDSQSRNLRVHPGSEVEVPGYRFHVLSVKESSIEIAVIDAPK